MSTWLTVPIRASWYPPQTLLPMLRNSGVEPEHTIVMVTADAIAWNPNPGGIVMYDAGPPNIHRWWNRAIDKAWSLGADVVIVVNDDVICHEPLTPLADALRESGCTLAYPSTGPGGWCFALNLAHKVRPDERYQWWFGDNDLWRRAHDAHGVVKVRLNIEHLRKDANVLEPWQSELVEQDRALYEAQYGERATDAIV